MQTQAGELYRKLSADFRAEAKYRFLELGEGMLQGRDKNSPATFLINTNTKEAWELRSADNHLSCWDESALDKATISSLPKSVSGLARCLYTPYDFNVWNFDEGVAIVEWTLQLDGCYDRDEDGFGGTNDREIILYAYIDTRANILIPFQEMFGNNFRNHYHIQAVEVLHNNGNVPYIYLSPEITVPVSEKNNLVSYRKKMLKDIHEMMFEFREETRIANKKVYPERFSTSARIALTPERHISMIIEGKAIWRERGRYELSITRFFPDKSGEDKEYRVSIGVFSMAEIEKLTGIKDNFGIILNESLGTVQLIYFSQPPK